MHGTFKSSKDINGFVTPLKIIGSIVGNGGLIISTNEESNKVSVYAKQNTSIFIFHDWKKIFDDFTFEDEEIGIYKIQEFCKIFSLIENKECDFNFDNKSGLVTISQDNMTFTCTTAEDRRGIKKASGIVQNIDYLCDITFDNHFDKFTKALRVYTDEDYVFFTSNIAKNTIEISIKNRTNVRNYFKITLDNIKYNTETDFEVIFKKESLISIFELVNKTVSISLTEKLCKIFIETETSDTTAYVACSRKV